MIKKIEIGDILVSLFLAAVVRQFLWVIPHNALSWVLTFFITACLFCFHLRLKENILLCGESSRLLFGVMVIIPLSGIYASRVCLPDISFDTLHYHITLGQRSLEGFPYRPGDFFPFGSGNLPPTADMFLGFFRSILGYRLGTIGNFLALLWTALVVDKLLRHTISIPWRRYLFILFTVSSEYVLGTVSTYSVDLLAVPLLLEVTWLLCEFESIANKEYYLCYISLLLGLSLALKIGSIVFIIPLFVWTLITIKTKSRIRVSLHRAMLLLLVFLIPILPFSLYMYLQTGSPLFPFFNKLFRSKYWPLSTFEDLRWGPKGIIETLLWPLVSVLNPHRLSELKVYSGRLAIAFLALPWTLRWGDARQRSLTYVWLTAALLWSVTTGYVRYGLYLEILGGLIVATLIVSASAWPDGSLGKAVRYVFLLLLTVQSLFAFRYTGSADWSFRPIVFANVQLHLENAALFFRDHYLRSFLSGPGVELIEKAEVWVVGSNRTVGYESLLKDDIPIMNIVEDGFFQTSASQEKFSEAMRKSAHKKMIAFCDKDTVNECRQNIVKRGLLIGKVDNVSLPYFGYPVFPSYVIEVLPGPGAISSGGLHVSAEKEALPMLPDAFKAHISIIDMPPSVKSGSILAVTASIANASILEWKVGGSPDGSFSINLAYHVLDGSGRVILHDGPRTRLPRDLRPGEEARLSASVRAPEKPGDYIFEFDLVQEKVAWFQESGSQTARVSVKVQ